MFLNFPLLKNRAYFLKFNEPPPDAQSMTTLILSSASKTYFTPSSLAQQEGTVNALVEYPEERRPSLALLLESLVFQYLIWSDYLTKTSPQF